MELKARGIKDVSLICGGATVLIASRERAKALSYCQPTKGGGVKVLLRYFLTRK